VGLNKEGESRGDSRIERIPIHNEVSLSTHYGIESDPSISEDTRY